MARMASSSILCTSCHREALANPHGRQRAPKGDQRNVRAAGRSNGDKGQVISRIAPFAAGNRRGGRGFTGSDNDLTTAIAVLVAVLFQDGPTSVEREASPLHREDALEGNLR